MRFKLKQKEIVRLYINFNFFSPIIFIVIAGIGIPIYSYFGKIIPNLFLLGMILIVIILFIIYIIRFYISLTIEDFKLNKKTFSNNSDVDLNKFPRNEYMIVTILFELVLCFSMFVFLFIPPILKILNIQ